VIRVSSLAGLSAGDAAESSPATLHGKGKTMNKAKVTKEFYGAPDGEHYPKNFYPGDEITGSLAEAQIEAGNAVPLEHGSDADKQKKIDAAPSNKAHERAPQNKAARSSASRAGRA
jgi:hypothetical protein